MELHGLGLVSRCRPSSFVFVILVFRVLIHPVSAADSHSELNPTNNSVTFDLNPDSLRVQGLENGASTLLALNRLIKAKERVHVSRAALLPSLSLGFNFLEQGALSFSLPSVSFSLGFLIPSRWFQARQSRFQFEAEKAAFHLLRLDALASLLSLGESYVHDVSQLELMRAQIVEIRHLESQLQRDVQRGRARPAELDLVSADRQQMESQFLSALARLKSIQGDLRLSLGLAGEFPLVLTWPRTDDSQVTYDTHLAETWSYAELREQLWLKSLEQVQLQAVKKAAEQGVRSQLYSFLGGSSLAERVAGLDGSDVSWRFDRMTGSGSLYLGFDYFPLLRLSKRDLVDVALQLRDLDLKVEKLASFYSSQISLAEQNGAKLVAARNLLRQVTTDSEWQYQQGQIDLARFLDTRRRLRSAEQSLTGHYYQTALLRLQLARLLRTGPFARVKECVDFRKGVETRTLMNFERYSQEFLCQEFQ